MFSDLIYQYSIKKDVKFAIDQLIEEYHDDSTNIIFIYFKQLMNYNSFFFSYSDENEEENVFNDHFEDLLFKSKYKYVFIQKEVVDFLHDNSFNFSKYLLIPIGVEETLSAETIEFSKRILLLTKNDINKLISLHKSELSERTFWLLTYKIPKVFDFNFNRNISFILSNFKFNFELPFPDCQNEKNFEFSEFRKKICPGYDNPEYRCKNCGAVVFNSNYKENCCNKSHNINLHLPSIPSDDIINILTENIKINQNFARYVNMSSRPILQHAKIYEPNGPASTIHIYGIPYAIDSKNQFFNPIYLIFNGLDSSKYSLSQTDVEMRSEIDKLIKILLKKNPTLSNYLLTKNQLFGGKENFVAYINGSDYGTNLTLIGNEFNSFSNIEQFAIQNTDENKFKTKYIDPLSAEYDQLSYPLIFWNGIGGLGKLSSDENWTIKELRYSCISLMMQHVDHFIHKLATLREEYLCSIYGRIMQIRINFEFNRQMMLIKEKEIMNGSLSNENSNTLDYGIKTFIPSSLTAGPAHWKKLSNEAFLLSVSMGPPTFFITITENPYWPEIIAMDSDGYMMNSSLLMRVFRQRRLCFLNYLKTSKIFGNIKGYVWRDEYQQRGLPHCHLLLWTDFDTEDIEKIDSVITCKLPDDPRYENRKKTSDLYAIIKKFETHYHSKRCCPNHDDECSYHYPQKVKEKTEIINGRYEFSRGINDLLIVPHNPKLVSLYRAHLEIEPVYYNSCIGYVMKYATKDSDGGNVFVDKNKRYCGRPINDQDTLRSYFSTHIVSGSECFASIAGYGTCGISPTVEFINIHLPGEKIICVRPNDAIDDIEKRARDSMSKLERYFNRPNNIVFNDLTLCEYYSSYNIISEYSEGLFIDDGNPKKYVQQKKNKSICGINSVPLGNIELFSLRLLLSTFSFRSFDDMLNYEGQNLKSFNDAAIARGLINNGDEFEISLSEAIKYNRPPSELRFLLVLLCKQGANFEYLVLKYKDSLSLDLDTNDINELYDEMTKIFIKTNSYVPEMLKSYVDNSYDNSDININENHGSNCFNEEQSFVFNEITSKVKNSNGNIMFLQGQAGTGKTFLTKRIVDTLKKMGKNVLIAGTTGIAASQYNGGCTLHSLFSLGIDKCNGNSTFKCNIGKKSYKSKMLIDADLIIIDEASMLTIQTANKVDFSLRFLMQEDIHGENLKSVKPFGGKNILFVGDLLQLPPVIPNGSSSVSQRLITQCDWWNDVKLFGLTKINRSKNKNWNKFLYDVSHNNISNLKWTDVEYITVTKHFEEAENFFIDSVDLTEKFPLDRLWICPTNILVNEVNKHFHMKRNENLPKDKKLGFSYAITEVDQEIPDKFVNNLSYTQRFDFARSWIFSDIPNPTIDIQYGEPMTLMRNLNTYEGIVKNKRCWIISKIGKCVVVEFENGLQKIIPKIEFQTTTNGINFKRTQLPLKEIYAGTVHKSQGMTLDKIVIDLRANFWEHGQLYVALSRVRNPKNICILLPSNENDNDDSCNYVKPVSDKEIVKIVVSIENELKKIAEKYFFNGKTYDFGSKIKISRIKSLINFKKYNIIQKSIPLIESIKNEPFITKSKSFINLKKFSNKINSAMKEKKYIQMIKIHSLFLKDSSSMENIHDYVYKPPNFNKNARKKVFYNVKENKNFVGLFNFGKTCYINSFIQVLYHIGIIKFYLKQKQDSKFHKILYALFNKMDNAIPNKDNRKIVKPTKLINHFAIDYLIAGDLIEFVLALLKQFSDEIKDLFTVITHQKIIHYNEKTNEEKSYETVLQKTKDYFIIVNPNNNHLFGALGKLQQYDEINEQQSKISIISVFDRLPPIVLIAINRTLIKDGNPTKNHSTLLLPQYQRINNVLYKLFSTIIHHGDSLSDGHYTTFIFKNNLCLDFDDGIVSEVSSNRMKVISKGYLNSSAVMAIYIDSRKYNEIINQKENDN